MSEIKASLSLSPQLYIHLNASRDLEKAHRCHDERTNQFKSDRRITFIDGNRRDRWADKLLPTRSLGTLPEKAVRF